MTLQYLVRHQDPRDIMYIGAQTAYIFIGDRATFNKYFHRIDVMYKKAYEQEKKPDDPDYVSLKDREVVETYEKTDEEGISIVIEGTESGSYWMKHEFDKDYPPLHPVKNEDCALFIGTKDKWCFWYGFQTCEGCDRVKPKADGHHLKKDALEKLEEDIANG